jgi:hypothetical protein
LETYSFYEGEVPKGFKIDFEPSLFNLPHHRETQGENWVSFHLLRKDKKKVVASIHFHLDKLEATSPRKAPFGSIEFSDTVPVQALFDFYAQIEFSLKKKGIKKIKIKNPPDAYSNQNAALRNTLLFNEGFGATAAELSSLIHVDSANFDDKIESWEKRKLNQAKKAGLRFHEEPATAIESVFNFIQNCREERSQSLSMSLADFMNMWTACKKHIVVFSVLKEEELAAASISIRINKNILYNFYSAHPKKFDSLSPVVMLKKGMYTWSLKNAITLIDLGTSALFGKPNFGLLDFKMRIGGVLSSKLSFEKDLV